MPGHYPRPMNGLIQVGNLLKLLNEVKRLKEEVGRILSEVVFKAEPVDIPGVRIELPQVVSINGEWIHVDGVKAVQVSGGWLELIDDNGNAYSIVNLWNLTVKHALVLIELEEKAGIVTRLLDEYGKYLEEERKLLEYVKSVKNALAQGA